MKPKDETTALRKKATAGPAAAQDTTGTLGDANQEQGRQNSWKTQ
jgi:hypothetical protein